ncbi:hypothetical protein L9F63_018427, partial [Diploptera punctata]
RVQLMVIPVGCLLGGISMDCWGRQRVTLICSCLFTLGWWLLTGAQNHIMIFIGKIVTGFCIGTTSTLLM